MKNRNRLLILISTLTLFFLGIGLYFTLGNTSQSSKTNQSQSMSEEVITLSPEDIGLEMVASKNKKQVKFIIKKLDKITNIEYELSYEADSAGGLEESETGRITRGVAGEDTIEPGQTTYESKFLDLGSCSSNTCRYDTGVEVVNLLLKLTKRDGKVYQVEDSLTL